MRKPDKKCEKKNWKICGTTIFNKINLVVSLKGMIVDTWNMHWIVIIAWCNF